MVAMREGYPATAESVPIARSAATGCVRALGAEALVEQAVAQAVTEACTNVVLHAYREQQEPGEMIVLVAQADGSVCVTVLDDGLGVVPRADSPGMGMGLALISQFADSVELRSRPQGGSEVSMRFDLTPDAAAV